MKTVSSTLVFSLLVSILCFLAPLHAQDKVEIFGYFEPQLLGTRLQGSFYQTFTNKLRLDLRSDLSNHITFAGNVNFITYHGKTEWNVLDFLSDDIVSTIPPEMQSFYVLNFEHEIVLDNAWVKLSFKPMDITLGKQQISVGTGYVWNPTDVFNSKDVLDPTYEQPGHTALRLDVPLPAAATLMVLYAPESTWSSSAKQLELKGHVGRFDLSLTAIETMWQTYDYMSFDPQEMNFLALSEKRRLLGGSTAGELLGLGVWAEFAYNWMERPEDFYEMVVGGDYTFKSQTYVMCEYYRNTMGKSDFEEYDLNDWMRYFAAEQKAIARDQIYVFVQHPVTDLLYLGLQTLYSISDNSAALVPTFFYSLSDNVEIFAYLNFNLGKEGTAYARKLGDGGLIRLRVYF
jgi:hypothetical protein